METIDFASVSADRIETALADLERQIGARRHLQIQLLIELDKRQVPLHDGCRSLQEWTAGRLDLAPETAATLVRTARRLDHQPDLAADLAGGHVTFDRTVEESGLLASGAPPDLVARSRGWDLAGVRRMAARHRRLKAADEREIFLDRFVALQPNLDESAYRLWGRLPGADGRIVEAALTERAEQFPSPSPGFRRSRPQRHADALVAIAQDSLDGGHHEGIGTTTPLVSIFVDAELGASTRGEAGASIAAGPRVGPLTLEEILCDGSAEVLTTSNGGTPLALGPTSRTIPPKLRRFVLYRDGGTCTAEGCCSRYRLQPHHIKPRAGGGTNEPSNLTTLCWFHHHVIVHRHGYRIDPDSPPRRRRFLRPDGRDPP